jgi:hypothetical protein
LELFGALDDRSWTDSVSFSGRCQFAGLHFGLLCRLQRIGDEITGSSFVQLPWDEHFYEIVIAAWQAYLMAERRLTGAANAKDEETSRRAGYDALREGGAATIYLHHFAEIVMRARPNWLPDGIISIVQLRQWVSGHCTMLRTNRQVADIQLCGDVADALKHAILTRNADARQIRENDAVLALSTGFGELGWGEGKFGGTQQVIVLANSGNRALSSVLQNVIDAWRRSAGLALPTLGLP